MNEKLDDLLMYRIAIDPSGPLRIAPQFRWPSGTAVRVHIPGCAGSRGFINDDGAYVVVGAEREEDDEYLE